MPEIIGDEFEKVLDRLFRMMNARDSGTFGTEEEAQAWTAHVARLLAKHRLEEADVHNHFASKEQEKNRVGDSPADFGEYGLPKFHRRIYWTEKLGRVIADHHFCRMAVETGSNTLHFAGRQVDREVAVFVYVTLARSAIRMSERLHKAKELVRHLTDKPLDLRNFRESFYLGFVEGIRDRLKALRVQMDAESPQYAVLRLRSDEELDEFEKGHYVTVSGGPGPGGGSINQLGYAAGQRFAREVDIQTGVKGGTAAPRQVGGK